MAIILDGTLGATLPAPLVTSSGGTGGLIGGVEPIQPITASVASSALTCTLNPTILNFRNTSLTSGTINTRTVATAISVVVPSTATLGTVSAQVSELILLAIDNAGTVELAIVNLAGGNNLDETNTITTTALSSGSIADNVIYSMSARTSVPFRVVGFIRSTQATAGAWATAPSKIQGQGGQALAAMSSLGFGQIWQAVTRAVSTVYYNVTAKPIMLQITMTASGTNGLSMTVGGVYIGGPSYNSTVNGSSTFNTIIPSGQSYSIVSLTGTIATCVELR